IAPGRTSLSDLYVHEKVASWIPYFIILFVVVVLLMVSVVMIVYIVFHLMWKAQKGQTEFPIAEVEDDAAPTPKCTERWSLWIVLMIAIVSMGYVIPIVDVIITAPPGSPPFKTW